MNVSISQIIQILVFVFIFIGPVVVKVIKSAQEAKERRRLEQLRQQQIHEAMRTGRPIEQVMVGPSPVPGAPLPPPPMGAPSGSPQDRMRELAARRQAQIDALRRQRAMGGGGAPAPSPGNAYQVQPNTNPFPVVRQQTGQPPPQRQAPRPPAQPQRGPTKAQRRQAALEAQQAAQRAKEAREWNPPTGEIGGTAHDHEGDVTHRLVPDSPIESPSPSGGRPAPGVGAKGPSLSAADLRRAVILREVLAPPLSMRSDRENA